MTDKWKKKLLSRDNSVTMRKYKDPIIRKKLMDHEKHRTSHAFPLSTPTKRAKKSEPTITGRRLGAFAKNQKNTYNLTEHNPDSPPSKRISRVVKKTRSMDGNLGKQEKQTKGKKVNRIRNTHPRKPKEITKKVGQKVIRLTSIKVDSTQSPFRAGKRQLRTPVSPSERVNLFTGEDEQKDGKKFRKRIITRLNNTSSVFQGRYPKRGKKTYRPEEGEKTEKRNETKRKSPTSTMRGEGRWREQRKSSIAAISLPKEQSQMKASGRGAIGGRHKNQSHGVASLFSMGN